MTEKLSNDQRSGQITFLRAEIAAEKSEKFAKQAAVSAAQAMNALAAAEKVLPAKGVGEIGPASDTRDVGLSRDDLSDCLFAITQALDRARLLQSHVLSFCGGDLSSEPYRHAREAGQRIADLRRKLILELEARERIERGDKDAF